MNTTHTPGLWTIDIHEDRFDSRLDLVRIIESGSETHPQGPLCVAQVNQNLSQALDIANLIAAAPDMLEALELIHANAGESPDWIRSRIAPAIAKAKVEA